MTETSRMTIDALIRLADALAESGERRILGLVGAPAAGKSTVSVELARALGGRAAVVGMDGFHLAGSELLRLGRQDRKGAPDTFDVAGYVSLLSRLRDHDGRVVYAPLFDRTLEESIAGAVAIEPAVSLVITEGNYLLLDRHGWGEVAPLLDETWFLEVPTDELRDRLLRRRIGHGHRPGPAADWVESVDEPNIRTVQESRERADLVVAITSRTIRSTERN